jgi:hypothetical protein
MQGNIMTNLNFFATALMAGILAAGFLGLAPAANAEPGWESFRKSGRSSKNIVVEIKHRGRGQRIHLPIGPGYVYYDYPYYYSRGYYPTHIGGYVYYPYYYYRNYYGGF